MSHTPSSLLALAEELQGRDVTEILGRINESFGTQATFSTSFGIEDQAITHLIAALERPAIEIFTLDTGRLFPETYSTWNSTLDRYGLPIRTYHPNAEELSQYSTTHGPNAFYLSPDLRRQCCHVRKVAPLRQALTGKAIWITGIRAEQSPGRSLQSHFEWDENYGVLKYHPIYAWTWQELQDFVGRHQIPINPLHHKGFVSIGCAPCTRAIQPGEDFRAGRWWWEQNSGKECGLHVRH